MEKYIIKLSATHWLYETSPLAVIRDASSALVFSDFHDARTSLNEVRYYYPESMIVRLPK